MATNQPMIPSVLSESDRQEMTAVKRFGGTDTHISANESPWVPWVGDIEIKILRVENRTGLLVIALRSPTDQSLGKHRHRGVVTATTIAGHGTTTNMIGSLGQGITSSRRRGPFIRCM